MYDADGVPGLLLTRFDRTPGADEETRRIAQEDGCPVMGRYPADKYRVSSEEVVRALSEVCQARPVPVLTLLRQIAFAYLPCNGDAHAKNFSVHQVQRGEWQATPAYDLPSSYPYGEDDGALRERTPEGGHRRQGLPGAKGARCASRPGRSHERSTGSP